MMLECLKTNDQISSKKRGGKGMGPIKLHDARDLPKYFPIYMNPRDFFINPRYMNPQASIFFYLFIRKHIIMTVKQKCTNRKIPQHNHNKQNGARERNVKSRSAWNVYLPCWKLGQEFSSKHWNSAHSDLVLYRGDVQTSRVVTAAKGRITGVHNAQCGSLR